MQRPERHAAPFDPERRPRWSVMIPTYECAGYLREALAGVLAQDPGPERMQIEVVDDASSDGPEAVVEELGGGRVGFFRQPANVGHTANFNTCLERARGELVHLLHGDDCVREGFYAAMERPFLERPDTGAAFCRHIYFDAEGHWHAVARLHQSAPGPFERAPERLLALWPVQPPAMVVRRSVYEEVGGFDLRTGVAGEDAEMWVRIAAHHPVAYEPQPLALYRTRPGSLVATSMRTGRNVRDARRTIALMRRHLPPAHEHAAVRRARRRCAEWALKNASILLAQGDLVGAAAQLREGLRSSPVGLAGSLALSGVRLLSDGSTDPMELGLRAGATPAPNGHRRVISPVTDSGRRPRWSVMIPTYECAGYLREALAGVLAQDPGPERMQIEVVDDASSDGPEAVVEELGGGRVGFFRQPANVGHTANFNTCLERARGELVHLLHGDDCVREGFYAAMERPFLERPDTGAAFCRYIAVDERANWRNIAHLEQPEAGEIPDWLGRIAVGQRLQFPCMVVARGTYEALGGFDDRPVFCEDWEMWVRIAAHYPVAYEPQPLALYRVHGLSRTGALLRSGENVRDLRRVIAINREHFDPATVDEVSHRALRATALGCVRRSRRLLTAGDVPAAYAQLREAMRADPSPRVAAGAAIVLAGRLALAGGVLGKVGDGLGR